jgi:hypothetical protein
MEKAFLVVVVVVAMIVISIIAVIAIEAVATTELTNKTTLATTNPRRTTIKNHHQGPIIRVPIIRDDMLTVDDALESFRLLETNHFIMDKFNDISSSYSTLPKNNSNNSEHDDDVDINNTTSTLTTKKENSHDTLYQSNSLWIGNKTNNNINSIWIVFHIDSSSDRANDIHNQQKQVFLGLPGYEFHQPIFPAAEIINKNLKNNNNNNQETFQRHVLVHEGYHNLTFHNPDMYPKLLDVIQPFIASSSTSSSQSSVSIHWTGISIGGAMAMLAGTYFAYHHPTIPNYIRTFRQPRCGNQAFAALVGSIPNLNVWRIVYQHDDWETQRPFQFHYYHAGHLVWRRRRRLLSPGQVQEYPSSNNYFYDTIKTIPNNYNTEMKTEAYFRTIGNSALGYAGIQDYSVWSKYSMHVYGNVSTDSLPNSLLITCPMFDFSNGNFISLSFSLSLQTNDSV